MAKQYLPFPDTQAEMAEYREKYKFDTSAKKWYQQETETVAPTEAVTKVTEAFTPTNEAQRLALERVQQQFATTPTVPVQPDPPDSGDEGNLVIPKDVATDTPDVTDIQAFLKREEETARQNAEAQKKQDAATKERLDTRTEQQESWWDKIMGKETLEERESRAMEETGVDTSEYFDRLRADMAEMDSLQSSYDAKMAQRDMAVAGVEGVGMPQSWMDDRKVVITNKFNAELNSMAAGMNSKAASMQARNGMYDEAMKFASRAVDNYTADLDIEWKRYNEFADANEDLLNSMGSEYKDFVDAEKNALYERLTLKKADKTAVMKLLVDYPNAGITGEDSLVEATEKASRWSGQQVEELSEAEKTQGYKLGLAEEKEEGMTYEDAIRDYGAKLTLDYIDRIYRKGKYQLEDIKITEAEKEAEAEEASKTKEKEAREWDAKEASGEVNKYETELDNGWIRVNYTKPSFWKSVKNEEVLWYYEYKEE